MDEQFAIFNVQNPLAIHDNVRESAVESALLSERPRRRLGIRVPLLRDGRAA